MARIKVSRQAQAILDELRETVAVAVDKAFLEMDALPPRQQPRLVPDKPLVSGAR